MAQLGLPFHFLSSSCPLLPGWTDPLTPSFASLPPSLLPWVPACLAASGNEHGRAFRDPEWEAKIHEVTQKMGIGAQFGGKYFCHDVRVVRLPRHGASCPVGIGVSCSADRQAKAKITKVGERGRDLMPAMALRRPWGWRA